MDVLGRINLTKQIAKDEKTFYNVKDSYFLQFKKDHPQEANIIEGFSTSREVRPTVKTVEAAIEKNNNPATYPEDDLIRLAEQYVCRYLVENCDFIQPPKAPGSPDFKFNMDSSAGLHGKKTGTPKTREYLESATFRKLALSTDYVPVDIVNTKDEFLDIESDISRGKVRLVDCVNKDMIFKSKILYDNQNAALHDNHKSSFIKYGMVKQYGGFDILITELEAACKISQSDVSGYDKNAVLEGVYRIRRACLLLPKEGVDPEVFQQYMDLLNFVEYYTLNPVRLLPDGTVVGQDHSNSSGQNNTTCDNSILHLIILFYLILYLIRLEYGTTATYSDVVDYAIINVYSDDKIFGIKPGKTEYSIERLNEIEAEIYLRFGMVIKKSASKWIEHIPGDLFEEDEIEFLGGSCYWHEGLDMYVPKPRVGKLSTSISRTLVETDGPGLCELDQFTKLVSIATLLVQPVPHLFYSVKMFIRWMFTAFPDYRTKFDDILVSYDAVYLTEFGFDVTDRQGYTTNHNGKPIFLLNSVWVAQSGLDPSYPPFRSGEGSIFFTSPLVVDGFKRIMSETIATPNDISRIEKKIEDMTKKVGITEEGKTWLEESLDPFHDAPYRSVGFPDLITGNSVVQYVKQSWDYVVPATYTQDVHIFMDSVDTRETIYQNARYNEAGTYRNNSWSASATGGVGAHSRGGLVLRNSGTQGSGTTLSTVTGTGFTGGLPRTYLSDSRCRIISKGFEVTNTTPMINAGGAVTVYRDSTSTAYYPGGTGNLYNSSTPTYNASHELYPLGKVPETLAQVNLIPGVSTWEAAKGCYCVCTMSSQINNAGEEPPTLLVTNDSSSSANTDYVSAYGSGNVPVLSNPYGTVTMISPFFVSGAYFTGLPPGTSLRISSVYIIERFVDQTNLDLIVLSSPSPYYDPVAMELYARAAHRLPHGVPVDRNESGDWIKSIADVLGTFGVPGMPLVRGAVDVYNTGRKVLKAVNPSGKETTDEKREKRYREMEIALQKYRNPAPSVKPMAVRPALPPKPQPVKVKGMNKANTKSSQPTKR
jgi:hypothetical protein